MADRLSPERPPSADCRTRQLVVAEALTWIGTPYRHQASRKHVGCDCLGLVRGIWQALYGYPLADPGPYAPDWVDVGGTERLLVGAHRYFKEIPCLGASAAGDLLLFRWRPHLPARHLGILAGPTSFIHAYEGAGGVVRSPLVPQWRQRIAAIFAFPEPAKRAPGRHS